MRSCILRASSILFHLDQRRFGLLRSAAPVACWTVLLPAMLVLGFGCAPQGPKYEMTEVSGKVLYKGKALPGGKVKFVADNGSLSGETVIDEEGNYKLDAPVGPVHITVDNSMLSKKGSRGGMLHRPGFDPTPIKGTYIPIPTKYNTPDKTDLTYTVLPPGEPQVHEIRLE